MTYISTKATTIPTKGEDKMMVSISKTVIGNGEVNSVDARELHAELGVREDYSDWIKRRIEEAQLCENADFLKFREPNKNNRLTIILSLDSAKSIAMLERTDKGREVRQYFIECEKKLVANAQAALPDFANPAIAARAWAEQYEQRLLAEAAKKEAELEATVAKEANQFFTGCDSNLICLQEAMRLIGVRPNKGIEQMRKWGLLTSKNQPTAKSNSMKDGPIFKIVEANTEVAHNKLQTKVTGEGLIFLRHLDWPQAIRTGIFKVPPVPRQDAKQIDDSLEPEENWNLLLKATNP